MRHRYREGSASKQQHLTRAAHHDASMQADDDVTMIDIPFITTRDEMQTLLTL